MKKHYNVVLAGNPNCGKTTIFNQLTGAHQHVGNYPGVTVEKKTGKVEIKDVRINLIDLPGIYSLSSNSPEERVALEVLMEPDVDLVVNVVDASSLERNLYLTTQLMELGKPILLVMNMVDDARANGIEFDFPLLEQLLNLRIVQTVGYKGGGIAELKAALASDVVEPLTPSKSIFSQYDFELSSATRKLAGELPAAGLSRPGIPDEFLAIRLLENDHLIRSRFERSGEKAQSIVKEARQLSDRIALHHGMTTGVFLAEQRYGFIAGLCQEAVKSTPMDRNRVSEYLDMVLTNRFLGIPIFLAMMYLVFKLTFTLGEPLMQLLEWFFSKLANGIAYFWPEGSLELLRSLLIDGIIGGVGGVLIFLPNILLLFLAIAILEGTGYMSRAAFIMDRLMHKIGLHGKSFIPMLLGFGCTVPAIMATRTIESERDRITTIMVLPLISCGARLPIYALIIPAFFSEGQAALVLWIIYLIGILLAIGAARLLKSTLFRGEGEVFVMELPPYRIPTFRSIMIHMWERTMMYLKKAGTFILAASMILWALTTFPQKTSDFKVDYDQKITAVAADAALPDEARQTEIATLENARNAEVLSYTVAGRIGRGLEVVLAPLGFDWKVSSALIGAFAGKELFVSQLGIIYSIGPEGGHGLQELLKQNYTPLQGFCIMLFCLISIPCMATIAVTRRETGSWGYTALQLGGLTALAYVVTLAVYQGGVLLHIGTKLL